MGLLVIGTTTGGSGELLVHEETGLAFEAGNADALAAQIQRAVRQPDWARRLAETGRETVHQRFTIQRTVEKTEAYLLQVLQDREEKPVG